MSDLNTNLGALFNLAPIAKPRAEEPSPDEAAPSTLASGSAGQDQPPNSITPSSADETDSARLPADGSAQQPTNGSTVQAAKNDPATSSGEKSGEGVPDHNLNHAQPEDQPAQDHAGNGDALSKLEGERGSRPRTTTRRPGRTLADTPDPHPGTTKRSDRANSADRQGRTSAGVSDAPARQPTAARGGAGRSNRRVGYPDPAPAGQGLMQRHDTADTTDTADVVEVIRDAGVGANVGTHTGKGTQHRSRPKSATSEGGRAQIMMYLPEPAYSRFREEAAASKLSYGQFALLAVERSFDAVREVFAKRAGAKSSMFSTGYAPRGRGHDPKSPVNLHLVRGDLDIIDSLWQPLDGCRSRNDFLSTAVGVYLALDPSM